MATAGSLTALGLPELGERVYRLLLDKPGSTGADISAQLGAGEPGVLSALTALTREGLVDKSLDVPTKYLPVAPDVGLEVLIMRAQGELDKVRALTRELTTSFHRGRVPLHPELVEVVTGTDAVNRRFEDLQRRAKREVQCLDTPPYTGPHGGRPNTVELEALARGVVYRGIYDRAALEAGPGTIDAIARYVAAGEQARLIDHLPMKLATIDRELGFVPLQVDQTDISRILVIRPCSLLDTLLFVFDTLWTLATPISFDTGAPVAHQEAGDELTQLDYRILNLLAAGLKDKAIAHHIGLSYSTTRRHITGLLERLGAQTRFQAGLQAARLGFGQQPPTLVGTSISSETATPNASDLN
jgi:DNA-binding CsgD family transcriptional regulator